MSQPVDPLAALAALAPAPTPRAATTRQNGRKSAAGKAPAGEGDYTTLDIVRLFKDEGLYGRDMGGGKHAVACIWASVHTDQRAPGDSDTVIYEIDGGGAWPGYDCKHSHCQGRRIEDVIEHFGAATIAGYCAAAWKPDRVAPAPGDEDAPPEGDPAPSEVVSGVVIPSEVVSVAPAGAAAANGKRGDPEANLRTGGALRVPPVRRADFVPENGAWEPAAAPRVAPVRSWDFARLEPLTEDDEWLSLPLLGQPGYFIHGWSHLLAGYPKAGKTELLFPCVCDWVREGVKVLWLSEESETIWRFRKGLAPPSCRANLPFDLFEGVSALGMDPGDLHRKARESDAEVVIIDTVRNLMGIADENDNAQVARAIVWWESALVGRVRIYAHHTSKAGGEHGKAVAGAGAYLAAVDRLIEIHPDREPNRRKLTVLGRIKNAPDLLYEQTEDRSLRALGDPAAVALARVKEDLALLLGSEWLKTAELRDLLEPRPSVRQAQNALLELLAEGRAQRDPAEARERVTYRWKAPAATEESASAHRGDP